MSRRYGGWLGFLLPQLSPLVVSMLLLPSHPQILEDYLLVEDVPLLQEMAEEDEELDLYNEMTFGLGKVKGSPRLGLTSQHLVG